MLRTIGRSVWSGRGHFTSASRSGRVFSTAVETDQWMVWPRETEGNTYSVNWSLVGDGVTPTGEAYRNARVGLLTSKLSAKPSSGKVELKDPTYFGDFKLQVWMSFFLSHFLSFSSNETKSITYIACSPTHLFHEICFNFHLLKTWRIFVAFLGRTFSLSHPNTNTRSPLFSGGW